MSRPKSLDYLYGLQTFGIKLGLDNIRTLHSRLGSPADSYRTILIAGTNGKGSTASTLAAILRQAGIRAGLYTSPHLHCFTERIRIDGLPVSYPSLEPLIEEIRRIGSDLPLTFFEFTTALALEMFRREHVEVAILEVGMGGRLDATNVVDPDLSVITPIAFDHQSHLGETLELIAREKAGVMRPGVPVVLSGQRPAAQTALQQAADEVGAVPVVAGVDFSFLSEGSGVNYSGLDISLPALQPSLPGVHQQGNMAVALAAAETLRRQGVAMTDDDLRDGVAAVDWPGRLEWFGGEPPTLLDGAHNGAGAMALADYLESSGHHQVRWVVGMKRDKEMLQILQPLLRLTSAVYCVEPPIEEALPKEELLSAATEAGARGQVCNCVVEAFVAAQNDCVDGEIVLVAGSLFLVAAVRELLIRENPTVVS